MSDCDCECDCGEDAEVEYTPERLAEFQAWAATPPGQMMLRLNLSLYSDGSGEQGEL